MSLIDKFVNAAGAVLFQRAAQPEFYCTAWCYLGPSHRTTFAGIGTKLSQRSSEKLRGTVLQLRPKATRGAIERPQRKNGCRSKSCAGGTAEGRVQGWPEVQVTKPSNLESTLSHCDSLCSARGMSASCASCIVVLPGSPRALRATG